MNSKTKIIVLHMKEIIYTVIFATLGILILCLLFFMFSGDRHSSVSDKKYTPGVYTSSFTLGNEDLEVEVSVSDTSINSIRISNLSETVTAMYSLIFSTSSLFSTPIPTAIKIGESVFSNLFSITFSSIR